VWFSGRLQEKLGARVDRFEELEKVLKERQLSVVFQPLVDLRDHSLVAYECLARTTNPHFSGPPELFEVAAEAGRAGELGRMLRTLAVEECKYTPIFLNVHPDEFGDGWLTQPDDPIFAYPHQVYLEIAESVPLRYADVCHSILKEIRNRGAKLAVDDLGSGYSNLKYISDLRPDVVKLDRGLVGGLTKGTRLYRLVTAIVNLCVDMGAKVVAEGIETEGELRAVIAAGVHYGQGYLLARPAASPPDYAWPLSSS